MKRDKFLFLTDSDESCELQLCGHLTIIGAQLLDSGQVRDGPCSVEIEVQCDVCGVRHPLHLIPS